MLENDHTMAFDMDKNKLWKVLVYNALITVFFNLHVYSDQMTWVNNYFHDSFGHKAKPWREELLTRPQGSSGSALQTYSKY